jgi:hypothetical protein
LALVCGALDLGVIGLRLIVMIVYSVFGPTQRRSVRAQPTVT